MRSVQLLRASAVVSMLLISACATGGKNDRAAAVALDADMADFQRRIESYIQLHNKLEKEGPPLKQTADPSTTEASQKALATRIRAARPTARQGDIFTPAIAAKLRRQMNPQLRGGASAETRASIRDDAPAKFKLTVNADYPSSAPLPTMPPNVLAALPPLPEDLEFRIVDQHLVLRDAHANIIVDYMFDVMCAAC